MLAILSYSSHYPEKLVEVTEEELAEVKRLTERKFLFDTEEGQALIKKLESRPEVKCEVILCYQ